VIAAGLAGVCLAAEGSEHGAPLMDCVWKFLNFTILVVLLVVALRKPMKAFFKTRTELIEKSIKEAGEAKAMAEKALREVEEKLRLKDGEIEKMVQSATTAGEKDKETLIQEGQKMSEKILEQARANIEYELKQAREQLKADAAELAVDLAGKKLSKKLSEKEQIRILEESLKKLEG
ncbi:MAG: F0F1 ATP synthase subunit B, partial [bacterium]